MEKVLGPEKAKAARMAEAARYVPFCSSLSNAELRRAELILRPECHDALIKRDK